MIKSEKQAAAPSNIDILWSEEPIAAAANDNDDDDISSGKRAAAPNNEKSDNISSEPMANDDNKASWGAGTIDLSI